MDKIKVKEEVLRNLSLWTLLDPDSILKILNNAEQIKKINSLLDTEVIFPLEVTYRRILHKILLYSPEKYRYKITDFIKKLRQLSRKDLIEIPHCAFVEIYLDLINRFNASRLNWKGYKACVCLCHDVDSKECYEFINKTVDLEKRFKVRSTYNFLTNWEYRVEKDLLAELSNNNFEIGLHGWTHDIALGYRNRKRIKKELSIALEKLGVPVKGFRAPAFSVSRRLLEVLMELGIKYDSSMKTLSCYGQGVESPYPYRFPGVGIWEIPLTIQDDRIFRDLHLSCEEGLGVIKELTSRIINVDGVAVINTHPRLIKLKYRFYEDLLKWLTQQTDILICTMDEVVDLMEQRERELNKCFSRIK